MRAFLTEFDEFWWRNDEYEFVFFTLFSDFKPLAVLGFCFGAWDYGLFATNPQNAQG